MHTDFTPHGPQAGYTVTIKLTGTRQELSDMEDIARRTEENKTRQ